MTVSVGYDFDERHVEVDGVDIAYVDLAPDGGAREPPLLLVHGLGATLDHWSMVLPLLSRRRRVLALDLPGFGRSSKPELAYTPTVYVSLLAAFASRVGLETFDLGGHSMGGAICAEYVLTHPERVRRLILTDAAGMTPMPKRLLTYLAHRFETRVDPSRIVLPPRLVRFMVGLVMPDDLPFAQKSVDRILASMGETDWPQRVRSFVRSISGLSEARVRSRLAEFGTPTLIVWGARDRLLPLRHGQRLHRGIRGSQLVVFPETGHCPMIERPDLYADEVERFLAEGAP